MARPILAIPWIVVSIALIGALLAVKYFHQKRRRRRDNYPGLHIESAPDDDDVIIVRTPTRSHRVVRPTLTRSLSLLNF
jgi:hypothetical protein